MRSFAQSVVVMQAGCSPSRVVVSRRATVGSVRKAWRAYRAPAQVFGQMLGG